MKLRSGVQIPVRSGLPSEAFGVGPAGRALSWVACKSAVPPPAGSVGASWAAKSAGDKIASGTTTRRHDRLADINRILLQFLAACGLFQQARGAGGIEDSAGTEAREITGGLLRRSAAFL